jgi:hypothetical protein
MSQDRQLATVELLGVLAYGQLRSFAAMASAVRFAPDARAADRIADHARQEHVAYEALRDRLTELTELPTAAMDRLKTLFDAFFDRAPLDDWFDASVFFAFGIPLARDFGRMVATFLDAPSAEVVRRTLADRAQVQAAAIELLRDQLVDDPRRERARGLVADLLGRALTAFQQAAAESDALAVLLVGGPDGPADHEAAASVRGLAVQLLAAHRTRLIELGLEDVADL